MHQHRIDSTDPSTTEPGPAVAVASRWEPCAAFAADQAGSPVCMCGWLAEEHSAAVAA